MEFKIKANDILTFRNNTQSMVYQFNGKLVYAGDNGWSNIKGFNENLTAFKNTRTTELDIMKIQRPEKEYQLMPKYWNEAPVIWERKEKLLFHDMTYEEAYRNMWKWLAQNPDKMKEDWFKENGYKDKIINLCFACEECNYQCEKCPLDKEVIGCTNGLFQRWCFEKMTENYDKCSQYAKIIAELPWEEYK